MAVQTVGFGDLETDSDKSKQKAQQGGQSEQPSQAPAAPMGQSQSNAAPSQGGATSYQPAAYKPQQQGTGYTNIQKTIQASQPQQLAQTVAGSIQKGTQTAQQGIQQAGQQFQQQANLGQFDTSANKQLVSDVLADPTKYTQGAQNDPYAQQGSQFSNLISGQYSGPTGLQNQDALAAKVQAAQTLGTTAGQSGILRSLGGPQYRSGQQTLDQLILGQAKGPQIQQARQQALGLGQQLGQQEAGAQAYAQQLTGQAKQFGQDIQQQLGQNVAGIDTTLQQQATKAAADRDALKAQTIADLQSGRISQDEANLLGLTQGQQVTGDFLKNIGSYIGTDPTQATAQNVATPEQYAKFAALSKLSGQYAPSDAGSILGKYAGQDAQAGGFKTGISGITGDTAQSQKDLSGSMTDYTSKLAPVQEKVRQAQDISNMVGQRNQLQAKQAQLKDTRTTNPEAVAIQQQIAAINNTIAQKYPGAVGEGGTRTDWAQSNLQSALQQQQATQDALDAAYGPMQKINIGTPQEVNRQRSGTTIVKPNRS